ncbi:aminopeptidase [Exophiala aquamarina CBS 119918]|uniref:Aminopeptidase n=1 Tax=Exophiala aquamarina CBS 119918 TaxID=1182545 RepID=A0A072PAK2_9EURO|nr:aminopeptidase [Exophiala aquamarina CBS 119918]KEF52620.1 aminopeptidase [Exophiala aquamarina CBS 119918]
MCRFMSDSPGAVSTQGRVVLPTNVVPKHYDVTIEVDFEKFTFDGTVIIDLDVAEDSSSISLNTVELEIHSTQVHADGALVTSSPSLAYDADTQTTTISLGKTLTKGQKVQLKHTYTGQLNDKMAGFYRSKRRDGKYLAVSQFEATDARRALPCFDEPALKAEFTVTLIADQDKSVLSNMDVASTTTVDSKITGGRRKAVKFNRSPKMSTYLLAFVVAELKSISTDKFRLPIKVWMTPEQNEEDGRFALEVAAKTLAFYEKAFQAPYPLPKMDMVAIPDFAAGAMENWGLVTYRVVDLLFDQKSAGAATKERVAEVVQHELAHQWFGNLVTMDFWDGLWLNEGFATWMSWYSCNEFYPEWKVWETFVIDTLQGALGLDGLRSSHPIEVPVHRAEDINQIFDAISYSKGSAVLRMISKYIGEDVFIEGVRRYIKKHAWGNTQTSDLWDALADASGKDVAHVMDVWTKNIGYPVVTVTENEKDSSITVKQNRFLRTGDVKPEEDKIIYPVILGLKTKDGVDESLMLEKREQTFKLKHGLDFYKLNSDHSALYRTSYTPERLTKLGEAAQQGLLSVEDRAGMIADAGALAASGYGKTSGILSLLQSFNTETQFVVWNEILTRINAVRNTWIFEDESTKDALKAFQLSLTSAKAHELGWEFSEDEDHIQSQFKSMLFGSAGLAGDEKIQAAAKEMFGKFLAGDYAAVHPNLRASVFAMALRDGGEKEWDALLARYHSAPTADEKNTCLRSLGRAKSPGLIQKTLKLALSGEVKMQDIYMPIGGLGTTSEGIERRYEWMEKNWEELVEKLPPSMTMLSSVVSICAAGFTRSDQMAKVEAFFQNKDKKGFDRSLQQSLDSIRAKANWLERDSEDVVSWLKEHGYLKAVSGKL